MQPQGKKCRGSLRPGRPGRFGAIICPVCGARRKPMPGGRLPNHVAPVARQHVETHSASQRRE